MAPADLAAWANTIHYAVTEAVLRFDGVPVKCVGDGFLGFFAGPGKADRALSAARRPSGCSRCRTWSWCSTPARSSSGRSGTPTTRRTDIIGQTVNTAFLAMPFVAAHCAGGIGVTQAVVDELTDSAARARARPGGRGWLERDALTILEPRRDE